MKNKNKKEIDMIVGILKGYYRLGMLKACTNTNIFEKDAIKLLSKLQKDEIVIAEGEIDNIKWESPYNKLVFYFKGLPKMIGIKIIKGKKVKIILEKE